MKRFSALAGALLMALVAAGCQNAKDTHDADVQAIKNLETRWNQDYAAKDTNRLVSRFTSDGVLMTPGQPAAVGKDAIQSAMSQLTSDPAMALQFKAARVEVAKSGDLAFTQGTYTLTVTDPKSKKVMNDHGSYVTTYRKQADGTWKAVSDIATSDVPAEAAPVPVAAHRHLHLQLKPKRR